MNSFFHSKVLNGVRFLTSIGIIWIHVHFIFGTLVFHSAVPCFANLHSFPFLRAFEKPSFHLNTFWIISGFLCEYQLENMMLQSASRSPRGGCDINLKGEQPPKLWEFVNFFMNRIFRIMPVYVLVVLLIFHGQYNRLEQLSEVGYKCTSFPAVARALTFTIDYGKDSMFCAQHGWTLQNDVHGYLALTLLAYVTTTFSALRWLRRYKTAVYWSLYWISFVVLMSRKPFDWQHLDGPALRSYRSRASGGLDYLTQDEIKVVDVLEVGLNALWDLKPYDEETFAYTRHRMFQTYWSGIFAHGGSVFLGAALCSSLAEKNGKPSSLLLKTTIALLLLYVTGAEFVLSAVPIYFLLEALLCQDPKSPLAFLRRFLSLDIWEQLSPYSFGIYMVHFLVLFSKAEETLVQRLETIWITTQESRGEELTCEHYTIGFLIREVFLCLGTSLGLSMLLYHSFELPFRRFRKRFLSQPDVLSEKEISKKCN